MKLLGLRTLIYPSNDVSVDTVHEPVTEAGGGIIVATVKNQMANYLG